MSGHEISDGGILSGRVGLFDVGVDTGLVVILGFAYNISKEPVIIAGDGVVAPCI